ncbi:MAG TPA: 16S rRNA (guanine(527)-N(7))-methyltransferase RsmG [Terriglobales bacterium]|nr:16S rRNA (guanine(527)-N(7))-methyltransferase RsmG [Terriglobales bacterium]
MLPARIAELLDPFLGAATTPSPRDSEPGQRPGEEPAFLSPAQLQLISTYIDILLRWNARINLTAIRDPEQIVTRHFGESLFAARHLFPRAPAVCPVSSAVKDFDVDVANDQRPTANHVRVADLGSGAGFPGLPIKLWAPNISLTLIESNHKKAAFLREVTRALTLTDVNIQTARAEALAGIIYDVVTLRAVERFETILPTAARLVAPRGRLALLIGSAQQGRARAILPAFSWYNPIPIPGSQSRIMIVGRSSASPHNAAST